MNIYKHPLAVIAVAGVALIIGSPAIAADQGKHADHSMHQMGGAPMNKDVPVNAIIHKVDADKKMINVTHDPIPALKWPKMTMDLPVTKRVDLSTVKEGMKAIMTLKQGRDKQYRITSIKPAE